jgi:hypothetical protein
MNNEITIQQHSDEQRRNAVKPVESDVNNEAVSGNKTQEIIRLQTDCAAEHDV